MRGVLKEREGVVKKRREGGEGRMVNNEEATMGPLSVIGKVPMKWMGGSHGSDGQINHPQRTAMSDRQNTQRQEEGGLLGIQ